MTRTDLTNKKILTPEGRIHIIGAGPVGLFLAALLQTVDNVSVSLYEKRPVYTRTRMVKLASYLTADTVESYCADYIDVQNMGAIFDPEELQESLAFRKAIPLDIMSLLRQWVEGFCPLRDIEQSLSNLINERDAKNVQRMETMMTVEHAMEMLQPGDILIDCTGCKSLLRDHLGAGTDAGDLHANTINVQLEYAVVITFLYSQPYLCNEYCKYYKNVENLRYKFIPAMDRTFYDGNLSYVLGIVNITAEDYEAMPPSFNEQLLRSRFPDVAQSMDHFIDKIKAETHGEIVGDLEVVRIPLNLYRARKATSSKWHAAKESSDHPFTTSPVFLVGDSALGSPYFQSISLGLESAMHLAGLLMKRDLPLEEMLNLFDQYMYKQWLRVYMRSKMIKHNKDIFEVIDDQFKLLELLHLY